MRGRFAVFRGKRVLVTGDTGFKGSWLSLWLHGLGAKVTGIALAPGRGNNHYNLLRLGALTDHRTVDIRDGSRLLRALRSIEPEFVFHLAAQSLVRVSYREPKRTFDTNTGGSMNLLEAVRQCPSVRALVYVTSDKCYRNNEWSWGYRESDALGGRDPYSASKAAAELVFDAYRRSFFEERRDLGAASVRAGNVIGGGDWAADRIIPDCIRALRRGAPIVLRNPAATRPWQHVLEPLSGYLSLAAKLYRAPGRYGGAWNFGPGTDAMHSVRQLAARVVRHWGRGRVVVRRRRGAPHEAGLLHLNCDKARFELGWRPVWNFDRTVAETVAWYKALAGGASARELSLKQIARYMEDAR
jgi:CDP-glucose 4,6-dehydratase